MDPAVPPFDAETIAHHADAIRALARRLVFDRDRADDVAQDAMVAALEQRTPPRKGLGPWVRGVTRKLAANTLRRERRLQERHARVATPDAAPAPEEVLERLGAQRLVGAALIAVGEPYRRALYMRYFEGLPPRTIAAQLDLPVNTVHTHLRRGLAKLRVEIEGKSDERGPWYAALVPLLPRGVPIPTTVAATTAAGIGGTLLMTASLRSAILVGLLLLLGGGAIYLFGGTPVDSEEGRSADPAAHASAERPTLESAAQPEPGGAPESSASQAAVADAPATTAEVHAIRLAGRVLSPAGKPLAGVPVEVYVSRDSGIELDRTLPIGSAVSDTHGRFEISMDTRLADQAPESKDRWLRVNVSARHPRWLFATASFNISTTANNADTRLRERITLRFGAVFHVHCSVLDAFGQPVPSATCRWGGGSEFTPSPDGRYYEAITDAAGRAVIEVPTIQEPASVFVYTTGVKMVHAEAPGFARGTSARIRIMKPEHDQVVQAEIVLGAAHVISGRVVDDRGVAVAGRAVQIWLRGEGGKSLAWADRLDNLPVTNADGVFVLERVPAGEWELTAWVAGHAMTETRVASPARDVVLKMARKTGIVLHYARADGSPLHVNRYSMVGTGTTGFSQGGTWGDADPLELRDVHAGRFKVTVWLIGRAQPFTHELALKTGPNPAVTQRVPDVSGGTLRGRLLDSDGKPTAGHVELRPASSDREDEETSYTHPVGEDGVYRFEGLSAGTYELTSEAEAHAPARLTVVVSPDRDPPTTDLRLSRGATLRIRLPALADGAGFGWQLQVHTAHGEIIDRATPKPDGEGWVVLEMLPAGATTVLLESSTFRAGHVPNDPYVAVLDCVDGGTVDHVFPETRTATVAGQAFGPKGKPLAQHLLTLRRIAADFQPSKDMAYRSYGAKRLFTDDAGRFEAAGLLPGRYLAVSVRAGGVPLVFTVTGDANQAIELRAR